MMKGRTLARLLAAACLFLLENAGAQTSQIAGEVSTRSGRAIEEVSVRLVSSADEQIGRKSAASLTDVKGRFHLSFDWKEVDDATQRGGTWQLEFKKSGYKEARLNVFLARTNVPSALKVTMAPTEDHEQLTTKLDACANPPGDASTLYIFDFATDLGTPEKLNTFQQLLAFKLRTGIRADLEGAKLLSNKFDIRTCRNALVRTEEDAILAGQRLGCPGVISGFVEQDRDQLKTMVRFTLMNPPVTDFAPVNFSSDLAVLIEPNQKVNDAYLAFSSFVLGCLYSNEKQTSLAMQCFQHVKTLHPSPEVARKADEMLAALQNASPTKKLVPLGGGSP